MPEPAEPEPEPELESPTSAEPEPGQPETPTPPARPAAAAATSGGVEGQQLPADAVEDYSRWNDDGEGDADSPEKPPALSSPPAAAPAPPEPAVEEAAAGSAVSAEESLTMAIEEQSLLPPPAASLQATRRSELAAKLAAVSLEHGWQAVEEVLVQNGWRAPGAHYDDGDSLVGARVYADRQG